MMVNAIIVEQLSENGTLRSFQMKVNPQFGDLIVAFADEYDDAGNEPFHFLDRRYRKIFNAGFAQCQVRKLSAKGFYKNANEYTFNTYWRGIPTERNYVSYYALLLPEYGLIKKLSVRDPHQNGHEYRRQVIKDERSNRFIVYLECSSRMGVFDFDIVCSFEVDSQNYQTAQYEDQFTSRSYRYPDWENMLDRQEGRKVKEFFQRGDVMYRVLLLTADPTDATRLRLGQEQRDIQERLQLARLRDQFAIDSRTSVRSRDISQYILDIHPQIVHFSGHGTEEGELCFENDLGEVQTVTPDALAALFELVSDHVQCVILNACFSEKQAQAIAQHINYVIGMREAIGDQAAIAFASGFYTALGAGKSFREAYKFGIVQLKLMNIPEDLTPVLIEK